MGTANTKIIKDILRWGLCLCFLIFISKYVIENIDDFHFVLMMNWKSLFPIFFFTLFTLSIAALRYHLVLKEVDSETRFFNSYKQLVIARFFNKLFPQSGMVYRARAFKKLSKKNYDDFFSGFIAFSWIDLVLTLFLTFLLISFYQPALKINDFLLLPFLGVFVLVLSLIPIASDRLLKMIANSKNMEKSFTIKVLKKLSYFSKNTLYLIKKPNLLISGILLIILNMLSSIFCLYFYFKMIEILCPISSLSIFVALNRISNVIVITPGNLGFTEFLYGFLSSEMNIGAAQGIGIALVIRIINFLVLMILSASFYFFDRLRDMRHKRFLV